MTNNTNDMKMVIEMIQNIAEGMVAMKTELKSEITGMRQEMTGMNQRFDKLDKAIEGLKMDIKEFKTLSTQKKIEYTTN